MVGENNILEILQTSVLTLNLSVVECNACSFIVHKEYVVLEAFI